MAGAALLPLDYLVILDLEAVCDDPADPYRHEIVELPWLVFDLASHTVRDHKQIFITPRWNVNPNPPPDAVRGLGTDVAFANTLADAVAQFDAYIFHSFFAQRKSFCLLTDGPWDLRDLLFVEAARKAVTLSAHFRTYVDLRAEFARCYPNGPVPTDRKTIFAFLDISTEPRASGLDECVALAAVVACLLRDGHRFTASDLVSDYEWSALPARVPAVATPVASAVPVGGIIRLRGLPWTCAEHDVADFLHGLVIVPAGIHFVRNTHGKATGEAFVQLDSPDAVNLALARHKQTMGRRYIEVFKSSPADMSNHLGRADARRHVHLGVHLHPHGPGRAAGGRGGGGHAGVVQPQVGATEQLFFAPPGPVAATPATVLASVPATVPATVPAAVPASRTESPPSLKSRATSGQDHGGALYSPRSKGGARHGASRGTKLSGSGGAASGNHHKVLHEGLTSASYVVKVTGLSRSVKADDLLPLFDGLELVGEGIHIISLPNSSDCCGEAYVELTSETWAKKAISRSGTMVSSGYDDDIGMPAVPVEVRKSSSAQLKAALAGQARSANDRAGGTITGSSNKQTDHNKREGVSSNASSNAASMQYFLRVRNLAKGTDVNDIQALFQQFHIADEDVQFISAPKGNGVSFNGPTFDREAAPERVATVSFGSKKARDAALLVDRQPVKLGGTTVQLEDGGSSINSQKQLAGKGMPAVDGSENTLSRVVRMRGLPYASTEDDIVQFFAGYEIAPGGISRGKDRHGRASGEAWVTFVTASDANDVVAKLDKAHMGSRYIELKF